MTQYVPQVNPVPVYDGQMKLDNWGNMGVVIGPKSAPTTTLPTLNFQNNGGTITFTLTPPSLDAVLSKNIFMEFTFEVTLTGTAGSSGYIYNKDFDAPRFMPIAQCTSSIQVQLNNENLNLNTYQFLNPLLNLNTTQEELNSYCSIFPSMRDNMQNYNDCYDQPSLKGIVNNPLTTWGQAPANIIQPRGAWKVSVVSNPLVGNGNPGVAVVRFTSREPLILAPFLLNNFGPGIVGISGMIITLNFTSSLARVWSHNNENSASSVLNAMNAATPGVRVTIVENPAIHNTWISLPEDYPVPATTMQKFSTVNYYPTNIPGAVASNTTREFTSQNISLDSTPTRAIVVVMPIQDEITPYTSDSFGSIEQVSINFDNNTGINASCSTVDLFLQAKRNGYLGTYFDWTEGVGSVYPIDFGINCPINSTTSAAGAQGKVNLQVFVKVRNINQTKAVTFNLVIVTINNGLLINNMGNLQQKNSILTQADVIKARQIPYVSNKETAEVSKSFFGGSLSGGAFTLARLATDVGKAHNWIKKNNAISKVINYGAQTLGMKPSRNLTNAIAGYGYPTGASFSGGAVMSNQQLGKRGYDQMDDNDNDDDDNE